MRLLLDTHIAVWAALDDQALTPAERTLMRDAAGPIVLSAVSVWELRLKWHLLHSSGRRKGPIGPDAIVAFALAMGWDLLPMTARHAAATLREPILHKDPFDELLLTQAQEEGLRLLTRDAQLAGHSLVVNRPAGG